MGTKVKQNKKGQRGDLEETCKEITVCKLGLKKGSHMVKQKLNSSIFGWEEFMKYSGINGSFFNKKAGNRTLDRTFETSDSTNDALDEEVEYSALLLILIEIVIEKASKVVWIQRIAIVT